MSEKKQSATQLLSTYLTETEKVILDELPAGEREEIMAKLKKRWQFLNLRTTFDEYLKDCKLQSLEASEVFEVKRFMTEVFPDEKVVIETNEEEGSLAVSVDLAEGTLSGKLTVEGPSEEKAKKVTFMPFPTCLIGDPGLIWMLAHREDMSIIDARIAVNSLESDFWASKKGLQMLKKGAPRTFATFVEKVPAGALKEKGLKRIFALPGVLKAVDGDIDAPKE